MDDKEKLRKAFNLRGERMSDKEKIEEVLGILEKKIKDYEYDWKEFKENREFTMAARFRHMKNLLEEIKEVLEK